MKYFKIKVLDIVLIGLLVMASFIPNAVFAYQAMSNPLEDSDPYIVIKIDNEVAERIELDPAAPAYEKVIVTGDGDTNTIRVENGVVTMIDANCPDLVCVTAFPPIAKNGEQIICLPHKLVVEIQGGEKPQGDLNTY